MIPYIFEGNPTVITTLDKCVSLPDYHNFKKITCPYTKHIAVYDAALLRRSYDLPLPQIKNTTKEPVLAHNVPGT